MSAAVRLSIREDIHADTDGVVDARFLCDSVLSRRPGGNLPQELNTFLKRIRSECLV